MSEETTQDQEVQETEPLEQAIPRGPEANPLFKALYEAADDEAQEEEKPEEAVEEEVSKPSTLNEALDELDEEPEPEPEPEPEVEAREEEPAQEEPEKAKPKKKKVKQVIDPDLPETTAPEPAFSQQVEEDPDEEYAKTLLPEEREIFQMAKYAEKNMEGYDGASKECKDYFEKTKNYIETRLKEDPHVDLKNDDDYKAFMQRNRPRFNQSDIKKIEREMVISEAEKRATERSNAENQRLKHELNQMKVAPKVQEKKMQMRTVIPRLMPEEFHESLGSQEGLQKLAQENPFEYQIMDQVATQLNIASDLFIEITSGAVSYDHNNQDHKKLLDWVNKEQTQFIESGNTHKDGKIFMRRERFHQLPPEKRTEYYTWTDDDLLGLLASRAQERVNADLQNHRKALENAGYVRTQSAQAQQQPQSQPVVNHQPPRAKSAPRPGGVPTQPKQTSQNAMLKVLGI